MKPDRRYGGLHLDGSGTCVDEQQGRAFSRRITLSLGFGEPGLVRADSAAVRRILANLLANALTYTADGEKLTKAVTGGGAAKNYVAGIEYSGANLEAIYFGEGRCTPNGASAFHYQYTIRDHLGNARANFQANGASMTNLEEMHYYPFGMLLEGLTASGSSNKYMFNKIERNEEFGLNLDLAIFRGFDPAIGRWWQVSCGRRFCAQRACAGKTRSSDVRRTRRI